MEELHLRYHMQFCWLFAFQHGQEELADTKSIGRPSVSRMLEPLMQEEGCTTKNVSVIDLVKRR